jgi:hypothetical protein
MASSSTFSSSIGEPESQWVSGTDRTMLLAFVADAATEILLRDGLSDATPEPFDIQRGGHQSGCCCIAEDSDAALPDRRHQR